MIMAYCNYNDPQSVENLMRSMLRQLAGPLQVLPDSINEFVLMDVKALPTLFSDLIRYYHKIMVVTDAWMNVRIEWYFYRT